MPAWMCGSMPPGMTICPAASTTRAAPTAARLPGAPIAAILPPLTPISTASVEAGITTVPPETIRSNIACPPPWLSLPVARPIVGPQEIGAELVEARAADLAHHEVDLAAEDVDCLLDPGQPARHRAVKRRAAKEAEFRAEAARDQYVGTAPDAAVEHHRHAVADRGLDRRQHLERGRRLVELPPPMVRHDDPVAADLGGAHRVGRVQDALDDQGAREEAAVAFEVAPGLRRGRGLGAAEADHLGGAGAVAGMRHPIAERRGAAVADIVVDPDRVGQRLEEDRRLQLQRL